MKRVGRSWQGLLALWICLTPLERALAQSGDGGAGGDGVARGVNVTVTGPAQVFSPGAPIPADGAILFESPDRTMPRVVVSDPRGAAVEGATTLLSSSHSAFYSWKAATELAPAMYWINLRHETDATFDASFEIKIVEATGDRSPPVLASSPSVSAFTDASERTCCTTPLRDAVDHCALSEQRTSARVDVGLSSTATVSKLNQFLFKIRASHPSAAQSGREQFKPFGAIATVDFEEEADEYCVDVSALDIVSLETHEYPDLHSCVAAGDMQLGVVPIDLDDAFLAHESCLQAPDGREEQWCSANASACADGVSQRCELFRYACEEGPLPVNWRRAAEVRPDVDLPLRSPDERASDESCSVSTPGARSTGSSFVYLALLALLLHRASRAAR